MLILLMKYTSTQFSRISPSAASLSTLIKKSRGTCVFPTPDNANLLSSSGALVLERYLGVAYDHR